MAAEVPGKLKTLRRGLCGLLLLTVVSPVWAASLPGGIVRTAPEVRTTAKAVVDVSGTVKKRPGIQRNTKTFSDDSGAAEEVSPEESVVNYKAKSHPAKIDFDGSFRYLYGQGHMEGQVRRKIGGRTYTFPFKELMIMQTLRTRLYLNYHFDTHWKLITGVEDNRVLNDQSLTDTAHIHRFFVEGEYPKAKYRAGRFSYKVDDGNVLDATLDGLRLGWGPETERASLFWGRIGESFNRREGYILDLYKEWGRWIGCASYFDFKNHANDEGNWNRQKIFSAQVKYKFAPDVTLGLEYLQAAGEDRHQEVASDHGFVVNLNYRRYDYRKPGSYRLLLRYYRQPQASVITHTMNGYPGFFNLYQQHMGFEGAGLCWDYIIRKGVCLTLEGYDLCNYRDGTGAEAFHQKVLGGSLTFAF